ncbi:RHS repeat-associated core domain-containing protein [Selenomonas sp. WCT3]|uniref:RHS repeat domain-containing protein n=1 Tax=Selenomonas sp. WCT3 TaxID=3158785 RepID=UPI0009435F49
MQQAEYPTYTERFSYDQAGNRLTRTAKDIEEQYIYDVNNRLTSQIVNGQVETYRYDDAGNLLQDAKNTYEYDAFRRTSKVTTKAGDVQINRYDAEGLRYEMEENGKLVQFIFNENKEVITEETDGNITRLIRTSDLWARESEPEKTWYHYASDEQGSTIFITDAEGNVKNRYTYDAFGNTVEKEEQIPNRFQYTGQQFDPITQQYYLRARFYNPAIARFTQEDEYHGDGLNLYAYCANNPVDYYDPSGYDKKCSLSKSKNQQLVQIGHKGIRKFYAHKGMLKHDEIATNTIKSFDGPIFIRRGMKGEEFVITSNDKDHLASGVFVTRGSAGATPAERINNLALPPCNKAQIESKVRLTRDQFLLEGKVAPQPQWAKNAGDGIPRDGKKGWQIITDGGRGNNAIEDVTE